MVLRDYFEVDGHHVYYVHVNTVWVVTHVCVFTCVMCLCPWNEQLNLQHYYTATWLPGRDPLSLLLHVYKYMSIQKAYLFSGSVWLASRVITFWREGIRSRSKWQIWHICIHHACRCVGFHTAVQRCWGDTRICHGPTDTSCCRAVWWSQGDLNESY